jgi:hypothetical protein
MNSSNVLDLVWGALLLDATAFRALLATAPPSALALGLWVVLAAGLSSTLGQSIALLSSRVSKRRFAATVLLQALLFASGFLLWSLSVYALASLAPSVTPTLASVVALVGLAHAPQLFGVLTLTPYFGGPLQVALSIWTLLGTLIATSIVFALPASATIMLAATGWLLSQILQRTLGRGLVRMGSHIRQRWGRRGLGA